MRSLSLRVLFCVSTLAGAAAVAAASRPSEGVDLVASLYRAFAWEVIVSEPLGGEPGFIDQPRSVLERYLEPSLATLVLEDRACAERTGEICGLDFMPLWNSQDPMPSDLRVGAGASPTEVLVQLRPSPVDEDVQFRFEMVRTPAGLRVHDIVYSDDWSLRKALSSD